MTTCYVLVGLPYSGKSTYIKNNLSDLPVASSDKYIEDYAEHLGKTYSQVFSECVSYASVYLKDLVNYFTKYRHAFVWDQTNLTVSKRASIIRRLRSEGYKKIVCIAFERDPETHKKFIASRPDKFIPEHVMESMRKTYQRPTSDEGFDEIIIVR